VLTGTVVRAIEKLKAHDGRRWYTGESRRLGDERYAKPA